jgi:hypothetical protein
MTISDLKKIINSLPDETVVLLSTEDIYEVETIRIELHTDGRVHLILTSDE